MRSSPLSSVFSFSIAVTEKMNGKRCGAWMRLPYAKKSGRSAHRSTDAQEYSRRKLAARPAGYEGVSNRYPSAPPMISALAAFLVRVRLWVDRASARLGFGDNGFLVVLAVLIGIVTAAAAVSFHELIDVI